MICSIIPWNGIYTWRYVISKILYEGNRLQVELYEKGNILTIIFDHYDCNSLYRGF